MENSFTAIDEFAKADVLSEGPKQAAEPWSVAGSIRNFCKQPSQSVIERTVARAKTWLIKMFDHFSKFLKQAIEIAVSKFVVELCAMVISAVSAAILGKYSRGLDITTDKVFYGGSSGTQAGPQQTQQQQPDWRRSAFDDGWPSQRGNVSAW